ncbi:MAG: hypothetical protein E7310_00945 [Clostridiales bacterium]|nr:hypothetical protein [Clostridiales bacterium]
MGTASLIISIIALVISLCIMPLTLFPLLSLLVFPLITMVSILALVGLILGIVDWVSRHKKGLKKEKAIAGAICSAIAMLIIIFWTIVNIVFLGIGIAMNL